MKRVGIIGGMGPLASADLYMKIIEETAASSDQENIPLVIDSYLQAARRLRWRATRRIFSQMM